VVCAEHLVSDFRAQGFRLALWRLVGDVFDRAHPGHPVGVDHERRVRRVEDLVVGGQTLVDVAHQVPLGLGVQTQSRIVQQDQQVVAVAFSHVGVPNQEGEEPDEAGAAFLEVERQIRPRVNDAGFKNQAAIEGGRVLRSARIQVEADPQVAFLAPETSDLIGHRTGGVFEVGDQLLRPLDAADGLDAGSAQLKQGQKDPVRPGQLSLLFAVQQRIDRDPPLHDVPFGEVQQLRQQLRHVLLVEGVVGLLRLRAGRYAGNRFRRPGVFRSTVLYVDCRRDLAGPMTFGIVALAYLDGPGLDGTGAEDLLQPGDVCILQLPRGDQRIVGLCPGLLLILPAARPWVFHKHIERAQFANIGVELVQGFEKRGFSRSVLADQAGYRADREFRRILDATEVLYLKASQFHGCPSFRDLWPRVQSFVQPTARRAW